MTRGIHIRAVFRCRLSAATIPGLSLASGMACGAVGSRALSSTCACPTLARGPSLRLATPRTARTARTAFFCTVSARRAAGSSATVAPPPQMGKKLAYPERLLIYHAGTGRTTFLACLKLTTLFVFVFFDLLLAPSYLAAHEPLWKVAGVALSGTIPLLFVAYTTTPFVAAIHARLPAWARASPDALRRFARRPPPDARLEMATVGPLGRPRVTPVRVADLRPIGLGLGARTRRAAGAGGGGARARLGLVTHERLDVRAENAARSWWRLRAVPAFNAPPNGENAVPSSWVWKELTAAMAEGAGPKS